jgi:arylsulfatase A-like enzyme
VIDHLSAAYLGAYGNTWAQTPALDRLAAESLVFDRAIVDTPEIEAQYRSLWFGLHALCPTRRKIGKLSLPAQMAAAGYHTSLISDMATIAALEAGSDFADQTLVNPIGSGSSAVAVPTDKNQRIKDSIEATDAANFFDVAQDCLTKLSEPFFAWLHTGTLGRTWDAPLEYRGQYADEEDPTPNESADVPNKLLAEDFDPDELLAFTHAYSGQVSLIDELIGGYWAALAEAGRTDNLLFVLYSPRGFPLGEHRRVGTADLALHAELTHVPLLIRTPSSKAATNQSSSDSTGRTQAIVQPADLPATILDYCELQSGDLSVTQEKAVIPVGNGRSVLTLIRGADLAQFDRACIISSKQHGMVTPAWSLRVSVIDPSGNQGKSERSSTESNDAKHELFVKPDDWFEVNEVSNRCGEIVAKLETVYAQFSDACRAEAPAVLAPLPEDLEKPAE